jgi:hypothetical protein
MTTLVVMIWFAVTAVITCVGFCAIAIFAYGGALWNHLKREGREPRPPKLERWQQRDREFIEPAVVAASRKRQEEIDAAAPVSIADVTRQFGRS